MCVTRADILHGTSVVRAHETNLLHTAFEMFDKSFCIYICESVYSYAHPHKAFLQTGGCRPVTYINMHKTTWLHQQFHPDIHFKHVSKTTNNCYNL